MLFNFHSYDAWHSSMTAVFTRNPINNFNFFHLESTVPRVEKVTISELNADGSAYRVIYKADRGVGGYPVLTDETASGSWDLRITLEFNESIQYVRYKDAANNDVAGIRLAEIDPNNNQVLKDVNIAGTFKGDTGQTQWETEVKLSQLSQDLLSNGIDMVENFLASSRTFLHSLKNE